MSCICIVNYSYCVSSYGYSIAAQLYTEKSSRQALEGNLKNTLETERQKLNASMAQERMALQLQAQEVVESQRRFEMLQRSYQVLAKNNAIWLLKRCLMHCSQIFKLP